MRSFHFLSRCGSVFRGLSLLALLFTCLNGYGIIPLTSDYHVWGNWDETWYERDEATGQFLLTNPYHTSGTFDYSTPNALPFSVTERSSPHEWSWASVTLDRWSFAMEGGSIPGSSVQGDILASGINQMTMYAEGISPFRPTEDQFSFNMSGYGFWNYSPSEQYLLVSLRDVATGTNVMTWNALSEFAFDWPVETNTYSVHVDPTREYAFDMEGYLTAFSSKDANFWVEVTIPEPTIFTLVGLGSLALAMGRWRRQGSPCTFKRAQGNAIQPLP